MNKMIPYVGPKNQPWYKVMYQDAKKMIQNKSYQAVFGLFALLFVASGGITRKETVVETVTITDTVTLTKTVYKKGKAKLIQPHTVSEVAPVEYPMNADEYIKKYAQVARIESRGSGVPASIILAQGLIESNAGKSRLAIQNNNHFGMKCFSKHCKKGHCSNFTDDTHKDFFLKLPNVLSSYKAHSEFLKRGVRYKKCFTYGKNYRKWAHGLKNAGYATDKNYAEKLIGVIERYKLYQYD